ncbi:hypothetical protein ABH909_002073 [Pseudomonas sp. BS3782 TE3695]
MNTTNPLWERACPGRNRRHPLRFKPENIAFRAEIGCDTVVLSDFSKMLAIPLRDGCDLMDVIGRRLRAQVAE